MPNVFNCLLLDHLPIVVANRYKYQQPLPKVTRKIAMLSNGQRASGGRDFEILKTVVSNGKAGVYGRGEYGATTETDN
jgi:hypothetical protein